MTRTIGIVVLAFVVIAAWFRYIYEPDNVTSDGAPLVEVKVPALSESGKEGEVLFNKNCASCHGGDAAGQDGIAPPLVHIVYETNHHGDASFLLAAKNGVRQHHWKFGNMPPVDGVEEREMRKIVTYVRELQRANGIF